MNDQRILTSNCGELLRSVNRQAVKSATDDLLRCRIRPTDSTHRLPFTHAVSWPRRQ